RWQRHERHRGVWRGESARRSRGRRFVQTSFARRGRTHNLFIPSRMVSPREFDGDITADDRAKRAALRENAHVDVDHEEADGKQRTGSMNDDGSVAEPAQTPGNVFGKPENGTAEEQQDAAEEKSPEEKLLSG